MRSYSQEYAVMAHDVQKMCLLRCPETRIVRSFVSVLSKNYFEFHNNYPDFCVVVLANDG